MSQNDSHREELSAQVIVDQKYRCAKATTLTVWNKSPMFVGEGFTIFDSDGNLVFRVDTDDRPPPHWRPGQAASNTTPQGNKVDEHKPLLPSNNQVEVFICKPYADYKIEGSFTDRCCTIYTTAPRVADAQVKRKCCATGTMLGKDVYTQCIERGFDNVDPVMVGQGL